MKRLGLLGSLVLSSYAVASPPVQVELRSSWATPPFLLQILEAFHAEEPDSFFPFLDAFINSERFLPAELSTDSEVYKFVVDAAIAEGYMSEPGELASLDLSLALHAALPKLEAAYRFYADAYPDHVQCNGNSWVDWYGEAVCDVSTLRRLVQEELIDAPSASDSPVNRTFTHPKLLPFDHIYPAPETVLERPVRTAILYASLRSNNFRELHEYLYQTASGSAPVEYVLRHIPPTGYPETTSDEVLLSGYGVALDLKKMDYLALDDRRQNSNDIDSESLDSAESLYESDSVLSLIHQYPENETTGSSTPLAPEEMLNLGYQATQLLYDAGNENALAVLKQLAQDFPRYTLELARRVTFTEALEDEIVNNQVKAQGGVSMVWLNGVVVPETDWNPFSLLRLLRKERGVMRSIMSLGLTSEQAIELLTHRAVGLAQADTGVLDGIFDASDRPEGGDTIVWFNDFEKDTRYERWGSALQLLLRPMYPGQMPTIKLNLFNIVIVADLSQASTLNFLGGMAINVIERGFGYRWGVVPIIDTENGLKMARLLYWINTYLGRPSLMKYITRIAQLNVPIHFISPSIDWSLARAEFLDIVAEYLAANDTPEGSPVHTTFDAVITGHYENSEEALDRARSYAKRLSADPVSSPQGHVFVNGKHFVLGDEFLRNMQVETSQQLQHLQEQLYLNILTNEDAARISTYFYDRPEASRRRNKYVYPSNKAGSLRIFSMTDLLASFNYPYASDAFVYPPAESEETPKVQLTTLIVADLDSEDGLRLVKEALASLTEGSITRVSFVHNPTANTIEMGGSQSAKVSFILGSLVTKGLLHTIPASRLLALLKQQDSAFINGADQTLFSVDESLQDIFNDDLVDEVAYRQFVQASEFIVRKLKLSIGEQAIVVNGRVVGPTVPGDFIAEDFDILAAYEYRKRVGPVVESLKDILGSFDAYNDAAFTELVTLASSIISSIHLPDPSEAGLFNTPIRPRRRNYQLLEGDYTKFEYGDNSTALFHIGVLLDPLSEAAQRLSSLLEWMINDPAVFVELHINPPKYKELPLKRFYRYNLSPIVFDEAGNELGSRVVFKGLPEEPIYTLAMDVPPSWLVRPREALVDLDNILLNSLSSHERARGVQAIFSLDYLVMEGHARESSTYTPPRGLQMDLVTKNSTPIADTLVMANLGYLQFRTTPGVFKLDIHRGRGREVFEMESVGSEGWDSPSVEEGGNEVTLMSFEGLTLYPRVNRLPGMAGVDVLGTSSGSSDGTVLGKLKSTFSSLFSKHDGSSDLAEKANEQAEINIFTVASGLLYERFASIMILSVLRNTRSTVKFWFIENFLSPSFLEFIPHFAEAYGFQYELVTYKWPSWLRAQKEKQRIIWAYKILFLDVLFPMDLKKVIFVDADQIVRADLKELVELDLHGAPYGYTPMGDDNVEMEGFRFWKTGYWKEFLQGLPYHISALYVVDLVRFRQMAAGDILRSQYQHLSADPHSLANLDQDLPNNLQREVPIFSLPEDWLWCETWCSKDRLDRAKTIDLCQNPLTKEPKLARAKHIPEWEEYDAEVARFTRQLADSGAIRSGMSVADTNVLADAGSDKSRSIATDEQPQEAAVLDKSNEEAAHKKDEL